MHGGVACGAKRNQVRLRIVAGPAAKLLVVNLKYDNLRCQVLRRDGWRCQSCGSMSNLVGREPQGCTFRSAPIHDAFSFT